MKKLVLLLMAAAVCAASLSSCGVGGVPRAGTGKPLEFVRSFPDNPSSASEAVAQGRPHKAGKIDVVVLEGTYREMGRQYGALLDAALNENYEGIATGVEEIDGLGLEDLQELGNPIYSTYPRKYREIIDGLAETSGLGLDKAKLHIATNCFFTPGWGTPLPDPAEDTDFMVQRRDNLLALAEKHKGRFDPDVMMEVMSTPLEKGGAFRAPNLTSFGIVAEPGALKMWVRVPEYQEWVEIDLAQYFAK